MSSFRQPIFPGLLLASLVAGCSSTAPLPVSSPPERLFLQQVSATSAIIKWRGEAQQACISASLESLAKPKQQRCEQSTVTAGNHREALFTGLEADTRYFYSVGNLIDNQQQLRTAPMTGSVPDDDNTRIWMIGDSGTASELDIRTGAPKHPGEAAAVYAGYRAYNEANGNEPTDLFVLLGDNAYLEGTDAQWQQSLFEVYPDLLKSASVWPTIGNHEMGAAPFDICLAVEIPQCKDGPFIMPLGGLSVTSDPTGYDDNSDGQPDEAHLPYLDIFSLPTRAEAGGVPSGTEQYYSFDYGNVHFVSLDSQLSARDPAQRASMRQWLIADLKANLQDWTIVIFHHPPYSKGANHDSDNIEGNVIDRPQIDMRQEFTPLFEAHGVDLVYSGHSQSYERSYYLRGHQGTSDTYSHAEHAELRGDDSQLPSLGDEGSAYPQLSPTSGGIDDRVVYTVAGSSGKADHSSGTITPEEVWLRHPAHIPQAEDPLGRNGLAVTGSVVIDASASKLSARFINDKGEVLDHFVITR